MRDNVIRQPRRGFTLIEMMVVLIIMLLLLAIAASLSPKMQDRKKMTQATDLVQGALMNAKQRAKRDRVPTGVRLIQSSAVTLPTGGPFVQQLLLIQQPDDFTGTSNGATLTVTGAGGANPSILSQTVKFSFTGGGSFTGGFKTQTQYLVQAGDFLEVNGGGHVHLIQTVSKSSLTLATAPDATCYVNESTTNFRIIRRPRVLIGEQPVNINQDIAIDMSTTPTPLSANVTPDPATGNLDIVFAPGGGVLNQGSGSSSIYLYVRDITYGSNYLQGEPAIVSIHSRTGFISTHPVAVPPATSIYKYCEDGQSDGM